MQRQPLSVIPKDSSGSMSLKRRRRNPAISSAFLIAICLHLIVGNLRGDIQDCKSKVLNAWVMHCASDDGVRSKRAAVHARGPNPAENPNVARFKQPVSGDDLTVGLLSPVDIDQLVTDLYGRYQRATQTKEQFVRMINGLAAKCCNDKLRDSCMADASNLITCP